MIQWIRRLLGRQIKSLNRIELSQSALVHNYDCLSLLHPNDTIIPVLKSNAYGHGLREVCQILRHVNPEIVAVDSYPEYQIVHRELVSDVLIIGEMDLSVYTHLDVSRVIVAVYNKRTLSHLISLNKKIRVHIFLNTWMNREGIQFDQLDDFLSMMKDSMLELDGVMSHLAYGDHEDESLVDQQYERFKSMYDVVLSHGFAPRLRHINNSGWLLRCTDGFWNAHRAWLALYGYSPLLSTNSDYSLRPVLSVRSTIVSMQSLAVGETVGYDGTYVCEEDAKIVAIPFWYYEWLWRVLSNHWLVKHAWWELACAGRISMNLSSWVGWDAVQIGDEVCVISDDLNSGHSIIDMAWLCQTIVYEILVRLHPTIKRKIVS